MQEPQRRSAIPLANYIAKKAALALLRVFQERAMQRKYRLRSGDSF